MADHAADRLLAHIRADVAELQNLEQTGTDELELRRRRRKIGELQWQLSRLVSNNPMTTSRKGAFQ